MISKLKFSSQLFLILGAGALGVAVAAGAAFSIAYASSQLGFEAALVHAPQADAAMEIRVHLAEAHIQIEEALSGDESVDQRAIERELQAARDYTRALLSGDSAKNVYVPPTTDPEVRKNMERVQAALATLTTITERRFREGAAAGSDLDARFDAVYTEIQQLSEKSEYLIRDDLDAATRRLSQLKRLGVFLIAGSALAAVLLSVIPGLFLIRSLKNRVAETEYAFQSAIEERRLTARAREGQSGDELDRIARLGNQLIANFAGLIRGNREASSVLQEYAGDASIRAERLADSARRQAAAVEESAATLEELTASIERVTDSARRQAKDVGAIHDKISELNDATLEIQSAMLGLAGLAQVWQDRAGGGRKAADQAVGAMREIGATAVRIGQVLEFIRDISEQVNLLSLNASIEAARAGETGRGFAVVAHEISRLADRTAANVKEIESLVTRTAGAVKNGVQSVQSAAQLLSDLTDSVGAIDHSIAGANALVDKHNQQAQVIAARSESLSALSREIEQASSEQQLGLTEINAAVQGMTDETQRLSEAATAVSSLAGFLKDRADALHAAVAAYSTD